MSAMPAPEALGRESRLRISEVFLSLQGESSRVGLPTVFVRLTGCPLRCHYCDTAYAFHGGVNRSLEDVVSEVRAFGVRHVCVTGGEPLAQKACLGLMRSLCDLGHSLSLETSGALDIAGVDSRVSRIVDLKTPDSGECGRNLWSNVERLTERDEVKFVICSRTDYEWSRQQLETHKLSQRCAVLMSPSHDQLAPADLAQWIIDDRLPVRFQMQLHKTLWGTVSGR